MYYVSAIRRFAPLLLLAPLFAAAWFSIHLSRADFQFRQGTPESVARATEIEPRNTAYLSLSALQLDYSGADSTPTLERAAALNPLSSAPRIRLGLAAEIHGDFASAEKWLLDARRVDRQFEPAWTLANFYFRGENQERFWNTMKDALAISYGDRRLAFDLCWRMAGSLQKSAATVLDRAIPERHEVIAAYLAYLLESQRDVPASTTIAPAALKLARFGEAGDRALLLAACDALISAHEARSAQHVWAALGYSSSSTVFNGNFAQTPAGHGFDWRLIASPGVVHTAVDQPHAAWRVVFDGHQPESCALLTQVLILEPRARYALRWDARTSGLPVPSGVYWSIADQRAMVASGDAMANGSAQFVAASEITPLTLSYQRPAGQARAEGSLEISNVSIEKIP